MSEAPQRKLLLWCHAQAVDADERMLDMARPLTKSGRAQAKSIAKWLNRQNLKDLTLLCSPAVRAIQTVQALDRPFSVHAGLAPEATEKDVLQLIKSMPVNLLIVGHEPWISEALAALLGLSAEVLNVRKGSLWCLTAQAGNCAEASYMLVGAQLPD